MGAEVRAGDALNMEAHRDIQFDPRELSARHVVREGVLLAVLRMLDCGDAFRVVAEIFQDSPDGPKTAGERPWTFRNRNEATAFVDDALGAFTYLGCEIRQA